MTNKITAAFEVELDTPSEVQAAAREMIVSGLTMVRDAMLADHKAGTLLPEHYADLELIRQMLQEEPYGVPTEAP
jgi:hypothetical protein